MKRDNVVRLDSREAMQSSRSVLDEIARQGAQQMLQAALEAEVADYLAQHTNVVDTDGHRVFVGNGHHRERDLVTGVGPVTIVSLRQLCG
jgi:putative transposase